MATLEQIEAELQQAKQQLADQQVPPAIDATQLQVGIQQLESGINILARHSASSVAGSLYSDALVELTAARNTLRGV